MSGGYDERALTTTEILQRQLARSLAADRLAQVKRQVHGRNDPCPCGSGKKVKRCHSDLLR